MAFWVASIGSIELSLLVLFLVMLVDDKLVLGCVDWITVGGDIVVMGAVVGMGVVVGGSKVVGLTTVDK